MPRVSRGKGVPVAPNCRLFSDIPCIERLLQAVQACRSDIIGARSQSPGLPCLVKIQLA